MIYAKWKLGWGDKASLEQNSSRQQPCCFDAEAIGFNQTKTKRGEWHAAESGQIAHKSGRLFVHFCHVSGASILDVHITLQSIT